MLNKLHVTRISQQGPFVKSEGHLERSVTHLLHRASQCATETFSSEARTGTITARQLAVLTAIADNEGLSQTDLVERTGIDRSTMADLVARLLKRGLVNRRRTKEDARTYAVRLSPTGTRLLRQVQPAAAAADQRLLASLPPGKRQDFIDALVLIVAECEKQNR
jgi:DNA-binding MarR family transcriptional regulator